MRILVIGSGGREHALCWAIAASPLCDTLYCAPGNAGIADEAICVPLQPADVDGIVEFARSQAIDFVVVGPEAPLVAGLVDRLGDAGIKAFGPSAAAAALEGSKGFAKTFCARHGIPTAAFRCFESLEPALAHIRERGAPIVVKADGLAAGKGVTVAGTIGEAEAALTAMMKDTVFGAAGASVVIEECLIGEEASFFALVDGANAVPLAAAQDHKRAGDGDTGPNTGGMGAFSPTPVIDAATSERVMAEIIMPTVRGMAAEGRSFRGVLYAGLMITATGPQLIEYNVRFGDPECQVLIHRLRSDLLPALVASADGQLGSFDLRWLDETAVCVVMAANGYPGPYDRNTAIRGVRDAASNDVMVFHAGTAWSDAGELIATGGRVLGVTALGADIAAARDCAYEAVEKIDWPGGFCRRDIAWRGRAR